MPEPSTLSGLMSLAVALSAAATLVATAFCLSTFERWTLRRRRHDAAWTISLAMFVVATASLWAGLATEWSSTTFRLYYLFGAVLNVPVLALGTIYLLAPTHRADRIALVVGAWLLVSVGVLLATPLRGQLPPDGLPQASDHLSALPRVLGVVSSSTGALVLVAGAVWSAVRYGRGRVTPVGGLSRRRLVSVNSLIAVGTIVLGVGGSRLDTPTAFASTTAVGITIIFAGFLLSQPSTEVQSATN